MDPSLPARDRHQSAEFTALRGGRPDPAGDDRLLRLPVRRRASPRGSRSACASPTAVCPAPGWGMLRLAAATPRTAAAWTNSGTSYEQRGERAPAGRGDPDGPGPTWSVPVRGKPAVCTDRATPRKAERLHRPRDGRGRRPPYASVASPPGPPAARRSRRPQAIAAALSVNV